MRVITRIVIGCALLLSCSKSDNIKIGSINDLSPYAKHFIGMNSSGSAQSLSAANTAGSFMSPASISSFNNSNASTADTTVLWSPGGNCESTIQITDPDGTTTIITDYGSGCTANYGDCSTTYFGKSMYTYKNLSQKTGSVYYSTFNYSGSSSNYGSQTYCSNDSSYWMMNGKSISSGQWQYDTATYNYQGYYNYQDSSSYTYDKTNYVYQGYGKSSYANQKSTIESQNYSYHNGSDYYEVKVTVPIVRDYTCHNYSTGGGIYTAQGVVTSLMVMAIPISGHEIIKYSQNGTSGEFEIDYGNGACDSLITVYENGEVIIIDLSNRWFPRGW